MTTFINIDNNKTDENCAICLENININNNSITLECQHRYCKSCIDNLFSSNLHNKCPLCRVSIDLNKCIIIENVTKKNNNNNNKNIFDLELLSYSNSKFIHFETKIICKKFLRKVKNKITIDHICCSGTGCKINNLTSEQITILKKNFLENNTINYN
tara:strand:+ start:30 stop:500 length:471 start_codon:yes stop_codon:yes gene_type:complete